MNSIPTINIVAAVHLAFISAFIGMYMAETVIELYPYFNRDDMALHHSAIRLHYWIDILVEIPVMLVVIASGITMAFLVEKITVLHVIKISAVVLFLLIAGMCPLNVIKRHRMMKEYAPEERLRSTSKRIIALAAFSMSIFFSAALIMGFWLAYHRILAGIYS
jgi:hypothetical protein